MGVSKVVYSGSTLVDLTEDSVTPETLAKGVTAHNAKGEQIVGTMESNSNCVTISGINLHDVTTDVPNTYLQNATVKAYNGWKTTDFIPVEKGKFYVLYSRDSIDAKYCSKYDLSQSFVSAFTGKINCTNLSDPIIITGYDGYMRLSSRNALINDLEVYEIINLNWEA